MNYNYLETQSFFSEFWPIFAGLTSLLLILLILDILLRALALWKSARADQLGWFVALMVLNTMGILPIIYLLFFTRKTKLETASKTITKTAQKTKTRAKR